MRKILGPYNFNKKEIFLEKKDLCDSTTTATIHAST